MTTATTNQMEPAMIADVWGLRVVACVGSVSITGEADKAFTDSDLDRLAKVIQEAREFAFGPMAEVADG